jgi:hypothetical protein
MADFRALCAELVDAIDSGISTDRMHLSPVMLRARAALAQPEPEGVTLAHDAYVAFVQICKGNSDDAGTYEADEELVRRALKRLSDLDPGCPPIAAELDNNSTH